MSESADRDFDKIAESLLLKGVKTPDRLYHYTPQRGLLGILSSRRLWSTRIQYLNDSTEFVYTQMLWKNAVNTLIAKIEKDKGFTLESRTLVVEWLSGLRTSFDSLANARIYVACFSEDGDALSQWRGYCRDGGFSLGFDAAQLKAACHRQRCFLAPCIYDAEKQQESIEKFLNRVLKMVNSLFPESATTDTVEQFKREFVTNTTMDYTFLASFIKHPSFRDEREWRIVTSELPEENPHIGFREGRLVPIPHFEFELCLLDERLNIEAVIGPNPEMALAVESIQSLLKVRHCAGAVRRSEVPYREI